MMCVVVVVVVVVRLADQVESVPDGCVEQAVSCLEEGVFLLPRHLLDLEYHVVEVMRVT